MSKITFPPMHRSRRQLLKASAGAAGLASMPWLAGCGSSSTADASNGVPRAGGPRGLHVSLGHDTRRERFVTWFTDGLDVEDSILEFGPVEPGQSLNAPFPGRAEGSVSKTFGVDVLTHRATATGLDPDKPMRYRVSDGRNASPVQVVKPISEEGFRFAHFGDNGVRDSSAWVRDGVLARDPDFFLLAGDLCYADGTQEIWDQWFDLAEPLLATVPMMCTGGNHENKDGNGEGWLTRVTHPEPALGSRGWYTFDVGRVRFVMSTGGSFVSDGRLAQEILFVETVLARAALDRLAGNIDFIVFSMHYTVWTDQAGRSPNNPTLVVLVENILIRYGVDLAAVGHDHIYQRSKQFALGIPNPLGYVQVTSGGGGQSMRGFDPISNWSAVDKTRFSFVEYEVSRERMKATTFAVDQPDNSSAGGALEIIDEFEIPRRGFLAAREAALPVRAPENLLADIRHIEAHTRLRNIRHERRSIEALREAVLRG